MVNHYYIVKVTVGRELKSRVPHSLSFPNLKKSYQVFNAIFQLIVFSSPSGNETMVLLYPMKSVPLLPQHWAFWGCGWMVSSI